MNRVGAMMPLICYLLWCILVVASRCMVLARLIILRLAVILHICFVSMKSVARVPQHAIYVIGHKQKNRS